MEAPNLHAITSLNLSCIDGETETTPTGAGSLGITQVAIRNGDGWSLRVPPGYTLLAELA